MGPLERVAQFKSIETDPTAPQPFAAGGYFGLQQIRWLPTQHRRHACPGAVRLVMFPGAHYSAPELSLEVRDRARRDRVRERQRARPPVRRRPVRRRCPQLPRGRPAVAHRPALAPRQAAQGRSSPTRASPTAWRTTSTSTRSPRARRCSSGGTSGSRPTSFRGRTATSTSSRPTSGSVFEIHRTK